MTHENAILVSLAVKCELMTSAHQKKGGRGVLNLRTAYLHESTANDLIAI